MNIEINTVGDICKPATTISPYRKAIAAYDFFKKNKDKTAICVVNDDGIFKGLLTKTDIMDAFGGIYGYTLSAKKYVVDLRKREALIVNKEISIEEVSHIAMNRSTDSLYDPIVILEGEKYYGIVTIKDLLLATVTLEVEKANESNPLTGFPGNRSIEKQIHALLTGNKPFAILYLDLDNFKAYNDAYGFPNGDKMIILFAQVMKNAFDDNNFFGHVGGDDFVIITSQKDAEQGAKKIIEDFKGCIRHLYTREDWENGYIIANSRKDKLEKFPIATISIAIITNKYVRYDQMKDLTKQIVRAKKKAKQIEGNSIFVV